MKSQYLNSNLFTLIGAHLETAHLAQLCLTSRSIFSFIQPLLYEHFEIGREECVVLTKRQRNNIKRYLRILGENKKRCLLVKKFTAWNDYAWGGRGELDLLLRVVQHMKSLKEFRFIHIWEEMVVEFASSSGNDWSKVWAALQDREQLHTLVGMPSTTLAWNFQNFSTVKSLTLKSGRVQPEVDGHLPASLVHLSLEELSSFDENWFRWQALSKLESLVLTDIRKEEFETIYTAFERCLRGPSKLALTTIHLDVCALKLGMAHPDENDLVKFLGVLAKIKSIRTVRILSVPESLGSILMPDFSSRPEEPHEQADGKLAKALSEFHDLEHLTLVLGYRPDKRIPSFWRHFSGGRLDRIVDCFASMVNLKSLETNIYCPDEESEYEDMRTTSPDPDDLDDFARRLFNRLPSLDILALALHGKGRKYRRGFENLEVRAKPAKKIIHLKF